MSKKQYPELNDKEMINILDETKQLYEDGSIIEAGLMAEKFARRIRKFDRDYMEANNG